MLNQVIGQEHEKNNLTQIFKINSHEQRNTQVTSNSFCQYFSNVGSRYAQQIGPSSISSDSYVTIKFFENMFLGPTDPLEINQIIYKLKKNTKPVVVGMDYL